jgi:outer membrane protein OmpA-like peptidoglycan-associated protein
MNFRFLLTGALALAVAVPVIAQDDSYAQPVNDSGNVPVYRVNVTEHTIQAIDYRKKSGTNHIEFAGTSLMPQAMGTAEVVSKKGPMQIKAHFENMDPASKFGPQYLTYVLWAITPEGRPVNLGEVLPGDHHKADIHATSNLQDFGLMITAEPYYAVTRPSDVVVLQNTITPGLKADIQPVTARYEALGRTEYTVDLNPSDLPAVTADRKIPLDLLEAENAIAIAKASGADQYAQGTFQRAQDQLNEAENDYRHHDKEATIATPARNAAQMAEDSRVIAIRKKHDDEVAQERREEQRKADEARDRADAERQRAEEARLQSERDQQAREAAEQAKAQADAARAQAEAAQQQAIAQQQQLAQQTQQAQLQAQQAQDQAQRADQARIAAEQQVQQTRDRLTEQLNQVLQTRQTARGLIVNMNDVLFDTGKASLKPGARVRLAKVAGIIQAYPDLKLEIDGYTDSTGSPDFNEELSRNRADSVRSFLVSQGVPTGNIITHGFGQEDPIASNETASGRQLNRRVELVVSGNSIGVNGQNAATPSYQGQSSAIGSPANPQ